MEPYYRVNGGTGRTSMPGDDNVLQFLSQEEKECLQFFEETIVSLEESLEENEQKPGRATPTAGGAAQVDTPLSSGPDVAASPLWVGAPGPREQDIIDLVRPGPDLVQRGPGFSPTHPDFQSLLPAPESHIEMKPRLRDPSAGFPSEYNPPLPSGSYGSTDGHAPYHPPGCIPTPVLIAQKLAENQAGGSSSMRPSAVLRRSSLDTEKPPGAGSEPGAKPGPPTSAKPSRYPANINVVLGGKEHQNQPVSNVSLHERRSQMLANLTGSHPLLQEVAPPPAAAEEEAASRDAPRRSISFKDPSPDKSRMEALSKLGLTRNRASSGGMALLVAPSNAAAPAEPDGKPPEAKDAKPPEAESPSRSERKPEIPRSDSLRSHGDRNPRPSPSPTAVSPGGSFPPVSPAPEVTSPELNSFGGKSIVVHPSVPSRSEPPPEPAPISPPAFVLPPALSHPAELNHFGGKSKVVAAPPPAVNRSDLPDILSSHIDRSQTLPAKPAPRHTELNSYGGKSLAINPSAGLSRLSGSARSVRPPAPTPAPRPPRHSYHGPAPPQRRPASMFRPQGITVQFSGRGATDESRRDALRKLGLLKES